MAAFTEKWGIIAGLITFWLGGLFTNTQNIATEERQNDRKNLAAVDSAAVDLFVSKVAIETWLKGKHSIADEIWVPPPQFHSDFDLTKNLTTLAPDHYLYITALAELTSECKSFYHWSTDLELNRKDIVILPQEFDSRASLIAKSDKAIAVELSKRRYRIRSE